MSESGTATTWDTLFKEGRYVGEPPVEFVGTILEDLDEAERQGYGLYVGCGNGRNYLPLLEGGLTNLHGMDVSQEGIRQLHDLSPAAAERTFVGDFAEYMGANVFDYLIAIQVFQHGDRAITNNYFRQAAMALKPGAKLYLRVNSVNTDFIYDHERLEGAGRTGKTVLYKTGPKKGDVIRYYGKHELHALAREHGFSITRPSVEVVEERQPPHEGTSWKQWETIWQKEGKA